MDENSYYRASAELAADLRDYQTRRNQFVKDYVDPYVAEFPNNSPWFLMWTEKVVGFEDGVPHEPPPEGLSRAQRRDYLIPVRNKSGNVWRERLEVFNTKVPRSSAVWKKYDIEREILSGNRLYKTHYADFGGDNVIVITGGKFDPVPPSLTVMRISEVYAIKEAWDDAHPEGRGELSNYP